MSYTKAVTLWCDGLECDEWITPDGQHIGYPDTVAWVREWARGYGWILRGKRDLCNECAGAGA